MKIKVDENIGHNGIALLRRHGHDVMSVRDQGLGGAPDSAIYEACVAESRTLITLDRDFGQVPRFPPNKAPASSWSISVARHLCLGCLRGCRTSSRSPPLATSPASFGLSNQGVCGCT